MRIILAFLFSSSVAVAQFSTAFLASNLQIPRTDLIVDWRFTEGSGQWVFNRVYDIPTEVNMLAYPEQSFVFAPSPWSPSGLTVTEGAAANPLDSAVTATEFNATSSGKSQSQTGFSMLPQAYTASVYAKSVSGSDQKFRFGMDDGSLHFSADQTANGTWQRLTYTWSATAASSRTFYIKSDVAGDNYDIYFYGLQLEPGSSATAYLPTQFHAQLGKFTYAEALDPSWVTGALDFNSQWCRSLSAPVTISNCTVYVTLKWTRAPTLAQYGPALMNDQNSRRLGMGTAPVGTTNSPVSFWYANTQLAPSYSAVQFNTWRTVTGVREGAAMRVYIDDQISGTGSISAGTTITISNLFLGNLNNGAAYFPGQIGSVLVYTNAHNQAQISRTVNALRWRMSEKTISAPQDGRFVMVEGDSISSNPTNYVYIGAQTASPQWNTANVATPSATFTTFNGRTATVDSYCQPSNRIRKYVVTILATNDAETTNYVSTLLKPWCLARRSAGYKVVVGTITPRNDSTFNAYRNYDNTAIRSDPSFYDALADFAADGTIGTDAAGSNATYYPDGTHPSVTCYGIMAPIYQAAVNSLW